MFLHGLIHLIGVVTFWRLGLHEHYSTKILGGALDVGDIGMRVLGLAWLIAVVAYAVVAFGMFVELDWWRSALIAVTAFSLVLTLLGWKDTVVGTAFNVVTLGILLI